MRSARVSPSTSSITKKGLRLTFSRPCSVAMPGWFSEASNRASRSKRASFCGCCVNSSGRDFDRDFTPELGVPRAVDFSHPTRTNGREYFVRT